MKLMVNYLSWPYVPLWLYHKQVLHEAVYQDLPGMYGKMTADVQIVQVKKEPKKI